ncbi:hypothetical protein AGIG_G6394 [Arapaima gigas]
MTQQSESSRKFLGKSCVRVKDWSPESVQWLQARSKKVLEIPCLRGRLIFPRGFYYSSFGEGLTRLYPQQLCCPAIEYDLNSPQYIDFIASQGDQRCVYVFILRKRAVAQPLEPVWDTRNLQARNPQPRGQNLFHVRDRVLLQPFMSSTLLQTEDTKKLPSKIFSPY